MMMMTMTKLVKAHCFHDSGDHVMMMINSGGDYDGNKSEYRGFRTGGTFS